MVLSSGVLAGQEQEIDPKDLPFEEAPAPLEVYWKERAGEILLDKVCFNYPEDTKENTGCRKLAARKFEKECKRYQQLYHDSRPYYDEEYERQMNKYCRAAEFFVP